MYSPLYFWIMVLELFKVDKQSQIPIYRQLMINIQELIHSGSLVTGQKLPGTRAIADHLQIHRQTVVTALDELNLQGWINILPGKGSFVMGELKQEVKSWTVPNAQIKERDHINLPHHLGRSLPLIHQKFHLDDGLPDPRLAPLREIMSYYKEVFGADQPYQYFKYDDTRGNLFLREVLADYLSETRSFDIAPEQILITRGVTQALYLSIKAFLTKGDVVAVPELNWESANANFGHHGIELIKISLDGEGIVVDHLEEICRSKPLKMIYLTPHHQYPTTVIMPAHRRVQLVNLCHSKGILLFEDDYDYDYHYTTYPLTPLAAAAHGANIIYAGSLTKALAPAFRVGYVVARKDQIEYLAALRRMVDRQGDPVMELVVARLIRSGELQRFLRKNRKIYMDRRNFFCDLLAEKMGQAIRFNVPEGGMSVWSQFPEIASTKDLHIEALKHDLYVPDGSSFSTEMPNYTRLGFAACNFEELRISVEILSKAHEEVVKKMNC